MSGMHQRTTIITTATTFYRHKNNSLLLLHKIAKKIFTIKGQDALRNEALCGDKQN
jgi:hypothetical protein